MSSDYRLGDGASEGPFRVDKHQPHMVRDGEGYCIALTDTLDPYHTDPEELATANARLLSFADLLPRMMAVIDEYDEWGGDTTEIVEEIKSLKAEVRRREAKIRFHNPRRDGDKTAETAKATRKREREKDERKIIAKIWREETDK